MSTIHIPVLFVLTVLGAIGAGFVLPAGKCRTFGINPIPIDLHALAAIGKWKIIYATDTYRDMDHEYRDTYILGENMYRVHDKRTYKNKSKNDYTFLEEYIGNVIHEYSILGKGIKEKFYIYPLGYIEGALLYYRCSDNGRSDIDARIIEIPRYLTLSNAARIKLLDIDKSCNFRGDLKELPYNVEE